MVCRASNTGCNHCVTDDPERGRARLPALAFSLLTQIVVAWGSLGVGSAVGAELAGVPFREPAIYSAWMQALVLLGHLIVFWVLLAP